MAGIQVVAGLPAVLFPKQRAEWKAVSTMGEFSSIFADLGAWNWLILAGLFMVLELFAPGIFLIWFGIAAAIVGTLALMFDVAWQWQLILFAVLSLVAVYVARKYLHSDDEPSENPLLNRRVQQYMGKTYVVAVPIEKGRGKVKIGDTLWRVEGPDAVKGAQVKVTGSDGTTLLVEAS